MGGMSPIPAGIYSQSPHGKADVEIELEPLIPAFPEDPEPLCVPLIHPTRPFFPSGTPSRVRNQSQREKLPRPWIIRIWDAEPRQQIPNPGGILPSLFLVPTRYRHSKLGSGKNPNFGELRVSQSRNPTFNPEWRRR